MRVFQVEQDWSIEHLQMASKPMPQPATGEVRLKMRAAALNYRDLIIPSHGYGKRMKDLPLIVLSDGVGVIDAVGAGVTRFQVGERVCPIFYQTWVDGAPNAERMQSSLGCEQDGTMATHLVIPEEGVCRVPAYLSDFEAATLPTAGVTAWRALITEGRLKRGETVLVQGTGGVSLFALQIAKSLRAVVIITSSSDKKLASAKSLGADYLINYEKEPQWWRTVREHTRGVGVDHIVEVGGADTLAQSVRAVRTGGTISLIGVLSGSDPKIPLGQVVTRHIRLQGITVGSRADLEAMLTHFEATRLRPVVDRIFPFEALHSAMHYLASGKHFGKICIRHSV
ncbi:MULTISPECIES: zinc-dependent alcohol dehydrogenase family protein [Cupriavidus]|uniref:Zinc-containing alcohol dehydrogenase n=3 Tax=Cupriavidus TaxID=106589 RepID=A0A375CNC4_9BURK|nr:MULTISPECIES: NAD(P)-dependent alcohol dehydrogenase [Cupriavidus]MCO4865987.1 NAD(P)-dependent alcohol dehydrogenase [Cupriavidus sp. WGlv3]MCO4893642.1 NAD(P)-dependent alcohol dehydrogenase [Cupriavidus sp. WGtm5]ULX55887.1 NADPH:quinone oxidoreductase [Cupriavidus taiwanensis]CAP64087.1 putative Zinc-containing alcohol dehydrogenase [Cupriavidus taiwanensis LMG 19424]SOY75292.1 putative Zinc-containing alcohol dehydrogenase [Cupriavidus taiwanensis]